MDVPDSSTVTSIRHFLDDRDLTPQQILALLELAWKLKHEAHDVGLPLRGRHIALVMAKPSLRTRVSMTVAVRDLGGSIIEVGAHNTKLGRGEAMQEWAAVLGRMVDGIIARVHGHDELIAMATHADVPVVNALSDSLHPCQALADFFSVWEHARLQKLAHTSTADDFFAQPQRWAYVGDGNNVAHSLMLTASTLGVSLTLACPRGHEPDAAFLEDARHRHRLGREAIVVTDCPQAAVSGARVVYTDTWVSMGQEAKYTPECLSAAFGGFRVDGALMRLAADDAVFMHCLPAVVDEEVTAGVLRGPASIVLDQAENRLWTTKALLADHVFGDFMSQNG